MCSNCGSSWNKWDLHLHSCYSILNNNFDKDSNGKVIEERYIDKIVESGVKAIGLTNYYKFLDEDFNLKKQLEAKGIKVFLNLELRLEYLNNNNENFDFHIIFDDNLEDNIIKRYISSVDAEIGSTKKKLDELSKNEIEKSAIVNLEEIISKLNEESSALKGKYMLGIVSRGHGSSSSTGRNGTNYQRVVRKSDFVINSSDKIDNIVNDRDFWLNPLNDYVRPLLQGSDAHKIEDIGKKYSWIKSELTFEGLKQIIYEPSDRISLDLDYPDRKSDYQIIQKITFDQTGDGKNIQEIPMNPNLNAIIGGRSNGKSTLTNSIAKKLGNNNYIDKSENNSNKMFTFNSLDNFNIVWQDGQENKGLENIRDIEFLPQDYMIKIAENDEVRNSLIEKIIRDDEINNEMIREFELETQKIYKRIAGLYQEWKSLKQELSKLSPPEGDKQGILAEIEKLNGLISNQNKHSDFSEVKNNQYQEKLKILNCIRDNIKIIEFDIAQLNEIKDNKITIIFDKPKLSDNIDSEIMMCLESYEQQINEDWQIKLNEIISNQHQSLDTEIKRVKEIESDPIYKEGLKNIQDNSKLKILNEQCKFETEKLEQFKMYDKKYEELCDKLKGKELEIINNYSEHKILRDDITKNFKIKANEVEIEISFVPIPLETVINYLNGRSTVNNDFVMKFDKNSDEVIKTIFNNHNLTFNKGKSEEDLIKDIIETSWHKRNFILKYDGDNFEQMSQGKKAFVILTLLLEFSKDKKPVIIDQPEDSLDNRSIYVDLTKYLKNKKKERQIILVTHNPNIVVGADAENVIVANQHAENSPNNNSLQFKYINGALETSFTNPKSIDFLARQGIREHVIEILEGGDEAFRKREEKYNQ